MIKREAFLSPVAFNLDLNAQGAVLICNNNNLLVRETFIYSSLWHQTRKYNFRHKNTLNLVMLLLLSGDIHPCPGPVTREMIKSFCDKRGMKFFHQNIRSLHGKYDELKEILLYNNKKIDVFGLTEIFLSEEKDDSTDLNIDIESEYHVQGFLNLSLDLEKTVSEVVWACTSEMESIIM